MAGEREDAMVREGYTHIPGWGSDLPRGNRPAVPMERTPPRLDVPWSEPPPQQPMTVEVLKSVERPEHSRTFGTRLPPKGLSGAIRRAAFRRSENDAGHWLMLVAADRVDVVEGLCEDARRSPGKAGLALGGAALLAWWLLRRD
ncbi:hypothetical protein [Pseudoxanthomonas sp. J35]|uniref:hypothetical protein n=1 Tax=Pseudoxanthomonas sp. J35 TaxID=935852 RepID=UPI0004B7331D|nr:hypothetical protein [Pseudoxanthomonas sp. J35]